MGFAANEAVFARHEMCFALGENEVVRGIVSSKLVSHRGAKDTKFIWPQMNTD